MMISLSNPPDIIPLCTIISYVWSHTFMISYTHESGHGITFLYCMYWDMMLQTHHFMFTLYDHCDVNHIWYHNILLWNDTFYICNSCMHNGTCLKSLCFHNAVLVHFPMWDYTELPSRGYNFHYKSNNVLESITKMCLLHAYSWHYSWSQKAHLLDPSNNYEIINNMKYDITAWYELDHLSTGLIQHNKNIWNHSFSMISYPHQDLLRVSTVVDKATTAFMERSRKQSITQKTICLTRLAVYLNISDQAASNLPGKIKKISPLSNRHYVLQDWQFILK